MSLTKFFSRHTHRGQKLHWNRADEDGLPYRGAAAPMYTQEEFSEKTVKVADPHAETFDLKDQAQKAVYLHVLDGITNGWFQCLFVKRWETKDNPHGYVRIEWVEYFLEDGNPTKFVTPGVMELANHAQFLLAQSGQESP